MAGRLPGRIASMAGSVAVVIPGSAIDPTPARGPVD